MLERIRSRSASAASKNVDMKPQARKSAPVGSAAAQKLDATTREAKANSLNYYQAHKVKGKGRGGLKRGKSGGAASSSGSLSSTRSSARALAAVDALEDMIDDKPAEAVIEKPAADASESGKKGEESFDKKAAKRRSVATLTSLIADQWSGKVHACANCGKPRSHCVFCLLAERGAASEGIGRCARLRRGGDSLRAADPCEGPGHD